MVVLLKLIWLLMALFLIVIVFFYRRKIIKEPKIIGTVENLEEKEDGLNITINVNDEFKKIYGSLWQK